MTMPTPPHPGEVLRQTILRQLTVNDFARRLGVPRVALSRVIDGRAALSPELAHRLAATLGGPAERWVRMQAAYDFWRSRHLPPP